ncbi:hypothetical protein LSH36_184g01006 [Paralvinella palmiformis]|uniref:C2H2-type domain-containing protein n=1 Tax=Paralvinella palmiformis TaxID=53620 RepID=A0AAD9JQY5_9ANNE|nr:hypothetical protein LSH36_184g01006 [Paralvinella palmiformis]
MDSQPLSLVSSLSKAALFLQVYLSSSPYTCKFCGKGFSYPDTVKRHEMVVHLGVFPYKCHFCGRGFQSRDSLRGHLPDHTGEKPYRCSHCGLEFNWRSTLHRHIKKLHNRR